jgi:hypothetical protein
VLLLLFPVQALLLFPVPQLLLFPVKLEQLLLYQQ